MKWMIPFFFLFIFSGSHAQENYDVQHYRFEIELSDFNDTIKGRADIDLVFTKNTDHIILDLDLLDSIGGKGMMAYGGTDDGALIKAIASNQLAYYFPGIRKKGERAIITIWYKGIPSDGLIISKNKHGERTFFSDNWPNRAQNWIPCKDRPDDKASFEFIVRAPSHYKVISNGSLVEEKETGKGMTRTHWQMKTPLPTKVMVIGAARFAVKEYRKVQDSIAVSSWIFRKDSPKGFQDYSLAPSILEYFINYIAPYPHDKLANVQSKTMFGGMENASAIFYNEATINGKEDEEDLLAHEIVHQWFGNMASEKDFSHLWLSEGFATYLTHVYMEDKYGRETMMKRMRDDREEIIRFAEKDKRPVVDTSSNLMQLLNANSYQKGGWFLHMLRQELGDTVFKSVIKEYYASFSGSNAGTRDFESIAERISGKELTWFFDQWLYQGGVPEIDLRWLYRNGAVQFQKAETGNTADHYRLLVEVLIHFKGGKTNLVRIPYDTSTFESLEIPCAEKPVKIELDPGVKLLFKGKIKEQ